MRMDDPRDGKTDQSECRVGRELARIARGYVMAQFGTTLHTAGQEFRLYFFCCFFFYLFCFLFSNSASISLYFWHALFNSNQSYTIHVPVCYIRGWA